MSQQVDTSSASTASTAASPEEGDINDVELKKLQERLTALPKQDRINEINELAPELRQALHSWVSRLKEKALQRKKLDVAKEKPPEVVVLSTSEIMEKGRSLREKLVAIPLDDRRAALERMSQDEVQAMRMWLQKQKLIQEQQEANF